ncbi:hypothetical protein P7L53_13825 [Thermoleptolyngbya sichuanensis XZ-Cy5]|uniref:hypothetical protein n=1 Tax=Thermoleptolyngbya sichuanensis TaxID=2885951 RepID=UPI00240DD1D7|nr:hypothetical protein [Thermoleptolyngbya sichuanensis]MDG2617318.1 hypothetical protein [Thermoleptolyngbya sichuanensis XZ-Cy5]
MRKIRTHRTQIGLFSHQEAIALSPYFPVYFCDFAIALLRCLAVQEEAKTFDSQSLMPLKHQFFKRY